MNTTTSPAAGRGGQPSGHRSLRRGSALFASAALAATALSTVPASAVVEQVRDGSNITVFHNIDFVAVFGYGPVGSPVTVEVIRDGVTIGTATGPAVDAEGMPGLEVNHGPEGAAVAGDCWEGTTPDIRPGDLIRVTDGGGVDEVRVDDIRFTGDPFLNRRGDVLVPFTAVDADGVAIAAERIDSAEFRAGSRLRFEATDIQVLPAAGGAAGDYVMRYASPYTPSRNRDNLGQAALRDLLLGDGHATGFGHTEVLPPESMLVDGLADTPGPAVGCESPSAQWGVTGVSPTRLNLANQAGGLTVTGVASNASAVTAVLTDAAGNEVSKAATLTGADWTAAFTTAELAALDGRVTVAGRYTLAGGDIGGIESSLLKDLVAPNAPTASLPAGTYKGTQRVALSAAPGERIRYTLGDGSQAAPTADSGTLYRGKRLRIADNKTLKMVAVDEAGNVSRVARAKYRIADVPSRPRIRRASAGAAGGLATAVARWRAPLATNGSRITGYQVTALRMRRNGSVASTRQSSVLARGARSLEMRLRPGSYKFRVKAVNAVGSSRLSARSNEVRSQ